MGPHDIAGNRNARQIDRRSVFRNTHFPCVRLIVTDHQKLLRPLQNCVLSGRKIDVLLNDPIVSQYQSTAFLSICVLIWAKVHIADVTGVFVRFVGYIHYRPPFPIATRPIDRAVGRTGSKPLRRTDIVRICCRRATISP